MNHAQCAAKLLKYADRCVAAYDAADPSHRSAAMKTALSECFHDFSSLKPNLQLGMSTPIPASMYTPPTLNVTTIAHCAPEQFATNRSGQ